MLLYDADAESKVPMNKSQEAMVYPTLVVISCGRKHSNLTKRGLDTL